MKKILKIILILVLLIICGIAIHITRNYIIIKNLQNKVSTYLNNDNYYIKLIVEQEDTHSVNETYSKGNKAVVIRNEFSNKNFSTQKIMNYFENDKSRGFLDTKEQKIAFLNTNGMPSKLKVENTCELYTKKANNMIILELLKTKIKNIKYNDKDCYLINNSLNYNMYVEKETGLIVKKNMQQYIKGNTDKYDEYKYTYSFNNVTDDKFIEPDISQYKIMPEK